MKARMATLTVLVLALGLVCSAVDAWGDTLVFKEKAYVKGPRVMLGELAEIEGINAETLAQLEVASAAVPGDSKYIDTALLTARLRTAGFEPSEMDVKGAASVCATTRHIEVTPMVLEADLRKFIQREMPWDSDNAQVEITVPQREVVLPDGEVAIEWRSNPQYFYLGAGTFRGSVAVDGTVQRVILCKADIEAYGNVVVTASDIPRGRVVTLNNAQMEKRALSCLQAGRFYQDLSEVVGFVAKKTLFPGQIIKPRDVAPPLLVKRNRLVSVETQSGGLKVQTQARASMDGAEGDVITCVNLNSKQPFQGVVRWDGVVVIP